MYRKLFILVTVLAVVSLACGVTVNVPVDDLTTGPTQTQEIRVSEPDASVAKVSINFGAGKLTLAPGAVGALISGEAEFNVEDFRPVVKTEDDEITLKTGDLEINGIPKFNNNIENTWDLGLSDMPMNLSINAGAYEGRYEFGGLALKSLDIGDGAADVHLEFSEPNKTEMDVLRYITGASNVKLEGLANANFTSMIFRGGAGDYVLDFSGDLLRDAVVTIESGISHVVIIVPEGVSAHVYFKGGMTGVKADKEWKKSGDQYTLEGNGPTITINIDMGAGDLELRVE